MTEPSDLLDATGLPLLVITGPAGAGRSSALRALHAVLLGRGETVVPLRFGPDGVLSPAARVLRPDGAGGDGEVDRPGADAARAVVRLLLDLAPGAASDPAAGRHAGAAVATHLARDGGATVLVDDAQWADEDVIAVLEAAVRRLPAGGVRGVVAVRGPGSAAARATLGRLRREGLAASARLGPLGREHTARELRAALGALPSDDLVDRAHARCRGVASALTEAVAWAVRAAGVVDGHAYPVAPDEPPEGAAPRRPASVEALGAGAWEVARAAALLHPLGAALPAVVAEALECSPGDAEAGLETLRAAGVLHRGRRGASWRFLVPLHAEALRADLRPFERRRLAALAVTAAWDVHPDEDYLTDMVAEAGGLLPPEEARATLVAGACRVQRDDPRAARRWWRAAAELSGDRAQRAEALLAEAHACFLGDEPADGAVLARAVLDDSAGLPPDALDLLGARLVASLPGGGERLARIADGHDDAGGSADGRAVCRAGALALLDRWGEARELLATTPAGTGPTAVSGNLRELCGAVTDLVCGHPARFDALPDDPGDGCRSDVRASLLLLLGEAASGPGGPTGPGRLLLVPARGDVDTALDRGRRAVAGAAVRGAGAGFGAAAVAGATALLLVDRGRLTAARELIDGVEAARPALGHLLAPPRARVDLVLGDPAAGSRRLDDALRSAARHGIVAGTDLLWAQQVELALARGDRTRARRHLAALADAGRRLPTGRAAMHVALARALLDSDRAAADACLVLARERAVPGDLASCQLRLVDAGLADPALLREAYDVWGDLDALLPRAWAREAMSGGGISVPGRQVTVRENERLLATLLSQGLTNAQIATALRTSAKSVEGRLGRMFARTGFRSRLELADALRAGDALA